MMPQMTPIETATYFLHRGSSRAREHWNVERGNSWRALKSRVAAAFRDVSDTAVRCRRAGGDAGNLIKLRRDIGK